MQLASITRTAVRSVRGYSRRTAANPRVIGGAPAGTFGFQDQNRPLGQRIEIPATTQVAVGITNFGAGTAAGLPPGFPTGHNIYMVGGSSDPDVAGRTFRARTWTVALRAWAFTSEGTRELNALRVELAVAGRSVFDGTFDQQVDEDNETRVAWSDLEVRTTGPARWQLWATVTGTPFDTPGEDDFIPRVGVLALMTLR